MSCGIVSNFSSPGASEWLHQKTYAPLFSCDDVAWAEEWLRRNAGFQCALKNLPCRSRKDVSVVKDDIRYMRCTEKCPLSALGALCCRVDRDEPAVLWLPESNPHVLSVNAVVASRKNGGHDLRECSFLKGVFQRKDKELHLLFRHRKQTFQLAVHGVSNIDRPIQFQHTIRDLGDFRENLRGFENLHALYQENRLPKAATPPENVANEQIKAMQALDGKNSGASHREIASVIFRGDKALNEAWEDCYRSRTQRVLRNARIMADGMGYLSLLGKSQKGKQGLGREGNQKRERVREGFL